MDKPGIEPGAYCLQSRRDTTTPFTQLYNILLLIKIKSNKFYFKKIIE